ncbi:hypothetical protein GCM10022234_00620 [Aeromicrobium panaciterrae]|uniref:hypothetical protein n=1 Tax=Aeromicrobium panaciterrae TaxID=363861 RepID=UPI0031D992A9
MSDTRTAAVRAAVAKFLEDRLKEARKVVNAEVLAVLDKGDRKAATLTDGTEIATVSVSKGRRELRVENEAEYIAWVKEHSPHNVYKPEPREQVHGAYTKAVTSAAKVVDGFYVDETTGEVIPGLRQVLSDPTVSVRISEDQADNMFAAFDDGRLTLLTTEVLTVEAPDELEEGSP